LIQQGIPAVLAMQFEITDQAAIVLSQVFYEALADGYPAEAALTEARKAIFASSNDVEWGTPVLYLRAPDGHLFDLTAAPSPQPVPVASVQEATAQIAPPEPQPTAVASAPPQPLAQPEAAVEPLASQRSAASEPELAPAAPALTSQPEAPVRDEANREDARLKLEAELAVNADAVEASFRAKRPPAPPEPATQPVAQVETAASAAVVTPGITPTAIEVAPTVAPSSSTVPLSVPLDRTAWLPAAVTGIGWIGGWLLGLELSYTLSQMAANTEGGNPVLGTVLGFLLGVAVAGLATGLALRWFAPSRPASSLWLLAGGWPLSLAVGLAISWNVDSSLNFAFGVALAGLLTALVVLPKKPDLQGPPALLVGAGWGLGWVIPGLSAWDYVFYKVTAEGYPVAEVLNYHTEHVTFVSLAAGGVLSGLIGAALLAWLLQRMRSAT
jgi:hypothetical protein